MGSAAFLSLLGPVCETFVLVKRELSASVRSGKNPKTLVELQKAILKCEII